MNKALDKSSSVMADANEEVSAEQESLLTDMLSKTASYGKDLSAPQIGIIVEINDEGDVLVDCPSITNGPVPAQLTSTVCDKITRKSMIIPQNVLMLFENGQADKPIILDTLSTPLGKEESVESGDVALGMPQEVVVDGRRISFNAREEVVLRCGKASITLTNEGRVIIRGAHVVSRSTGVNKLKGGSVQIN